jgi:cysteinyl-tRNA synthetase
MAKSAGNLVLLDELLAGHPAAVVRLMILDRPWAESWDYRPALLGMAQARLDSLYRSAARTGPAGPAALAELARLLAADLDVPAALDLAIDSGGGPARTLAAILGLS